MIISAFHPPTTRYLLFAPMPSLLLLGPFLMSFMIVSNLYAASVSLSWSANDESDLAGYNIYKRLQSTNDYGAPIFSGLPSDPSAPQKTINNLLENTTYEFVTTAFDSAGNESVPSNEIQVTTGGGSGGGSNGSFPPPMVTPTPSSTLTTTSVTFTGGHTTLSLEHWLMVGTSKGAKNLHNSGSMGTHTATVSGLPNNGTIHVRWWSKNSSGQWKFTDQTYTMNVGGGGSNSSFPPPMVTPTPSSTLTTTSVTFTGGHTTLSLEHWLMVGTSKGAKNLHNSGSMDTHTATVSGLPNNGTIHVRWWSKNSSGQWKFTDQTYTMNE